MGEMIHTNYEVIFLKKIARKVWRIGLLMLFLCFTLLIVILLYAMLTPISLKEQEIIIYDKDNAIIYQNDQSNTITLKEVDPFFQKALVAVEDQRFYHHIGFDPFRLIQALFHNIQQKNVVEGGSTITQQYAKNIFLSNEQTMERKLKEFFYSLRLEMHYSKDQILEGYINSIYYGHGIYGLKNAADFYFGKTVNELSIAEDALLIAIPNGPSLYSPYVSLSQAEKKRNQVLFQLYQKGILTQKEYKTACKEEIQLNEANYADATRKNYYIDAVLQEIAAMNLSDHTLAVSTYYDEEAQQALTHSIQSTLEGKEIQASGIIIEPYTFHIIALQGGYDFATSNYNRAFYAKRQIASTIKPLLYYLALEDGFTPSTTFSSEPTTFTLSDGSTYAPENYNKSYPYREISMLHAISTSDNIYAVKTHLFLGMDALNDALHQFGIQDSEANPSLALGCVNLSVYQITSIYTTFASEGLYDTPSMIQAIISENGTIYEKKAKPKQLLERDITLLLNQALTATYDEKNILDSYPTMLGKQTQKKTAVKSGTSNWDTWVVGFNPYYCIGIWNGYDDNRELEKKEFEWSKDIWKQCFNELMEDKQEVWYEKSNNIVEKKVNPISGKEDPDGSLYWYLK